MVQVNQETESKGIGKENMVLQKSMYEEFVKNIELLCPKYLEQIRDSLVVDEAGFKIGLLREPTYSFSMTMCEEDYNYIINYVENLHKEAFQGQYFDDEKYTRFDELCDFVNLLKVMRNETEN